MDHELLMALIVMWISTTGSLVAFIPMWVANEGEAFHPHCVCVDQRHSLFLVVSSETICKVDCLVASISAFVAPRGSSASKNFTVLVIGVAVSGFLGSVRWAAVGDAKKAELSFALIGFLSLILVSLFELDVSPQRFLEDKLLVTGWLIDKLGYRRRLSSHFKLHSTSQGLLQFLRDSPSIYWLYQEDHSWQQDALRAQTQQRLFTYNRIWRSAHVAGAISFVLCVTTSIIINDAAEEKVAYITGASFFCFCFLGWLSGVYVPLYFRFLKGYVLLWCPFFFEPHFMLKLKTSVEEFLARHEAAVVESKRPAKASRGRRKQVGASNNSDIKSAVAVTVAPMRSTRCRCCHAPSPSLQGAHALAVPDMAAAEAPVDLAASREADLALNNPLLRMARHHPSLYLRVVGHLLIFSELIALLTPAIAMGVQWITALCDGPPGAVMIDLGVSVFGCFAAGDWFLNGLMSDTALPHCILKKV